MKVKGLTLLAALVVMTALIGCGPGGNGEVGVEGGAGAAEETGSQDGIAAQEDTGAVEEAPSETEITEGGAFSEWDMDGSGSLDQNEFSAGFAQAGTFDRWDADGSGTLDQSELETALSGGFLGAQEIGAGEAFSQWDAGGDGALDANDVGTGLYGILDADGNGEIAQEEFSAFEQELQ